MSKLIAFFILRIHYVRIFCNLKKIIYKSSCFGMFSECYLEWSDIILKWEKEIARVRYHQMICDSLGSEEVYICLTW